MSRAVTTHRLLPAKFSRHCVLPGAMVAVLRRAISTVDYWDLDHSQTFTLISVLLRNDFADASDAIVFLASTAMIASGQI